MATFDTFQSIVEDPGYTTVDQPTRVQIFRKAMADPNIQKLSPEQRQPFLRSILFRGKEVEEPKLPLDIPARQVIPEMGREARQGLSTLREASQLPIGAERIKRDVLGGVQLLGASGIPAGWAGTKAGKFAQAGALKLGLPNTLADILGAVTYATVPVAGAMGTQALLGTGPAQAAARFLAPPDKGAVERLAATAKGQAKAAAEKDAATIAAAQAKKVLQETGAEAETSLQGIREGLPPFMPREQLGAQIKGDIDGKINELVQKARAQYGPIMEKASQTPTGAAGATRGRVPVSGEAPQAATRAEFATWRDLDKETMARIIALQKEKGSTFSEAAQQVLAAGEAEEGTGTVASLIRHRQRYNAVMRAAERRGEDNLARIARNKSHELKATIDKIAPDIGADLNKADEFFRTEYVPVAGHESLARALRDTPAEDVVNGIVRLGNKKAQLEAWDSLEGVLSPQSRDQLVANTLTSLIERSSINGMFEPAKALAAFRSLPEDLGRRMFKGSYGDIQRTLATLQRASGDERKAQLLLRATSDATKVAEAQARQAAQDLKGPERFVASVLRKSQMATFLRIIGIMEMIRGGSNVLQSGHAAIGIGQLARGATLAFPMLTAKIVLSPTGRKAITALARSASPKQQIYNAAVQELAQVMSAAAAEQPQQAGNAVPNPQ